MELRSGRRICKGEGGSSTSPNQLSTGTDDRNPMMNSVVLANLFAFCDMSELLEYRLVCREWHSSSLARIRNEMVVKITNNGAKLNWANVHKEFNVVGAPFRCFRLHNMEWMNPPHSSKPPVCSWLAQGLARRTKTSTMQIYKNVEQFWRKNGQFMRKLELNETRIYSTEAFMRAIFQDTPNLEKLELHSLDFKDEATAGNVMKVEVGMETVQLNFKTLIVSMYRGTFPVPWQHVFHQFPKIEKLELRVLYELNITPLIEVLESLDEIPLRHLKLFCVPRIIDSSLLTLFRLPKLKLTKLRMYLDSHSVSEWRNILEVVLQMHGERLEKLHIDVAVPSSQSPRDQLEPPNTFPYRPDTLEQLTHLKLRQPIFENFLFLPQTPNLRVLHVSWCERNKDIMELGLECVKNQVVLSHLEEFHINNGHQLSEEEMDVFVKIMPDVEDFKGRIRTSALRVICKHWKKLRVLEFISSDIGDDAITGMEEGTEERFPNITDLENLRSVKTFNGRMSDSSIWNGFMKLPCLSFVWLTFSSQTSQEAMDVLQKRIPRAKIYKK